MRDRYDFFDSNRVPTPSAWSGRLRFVWTRTPSRVSKLFGQAEGLPYQSLVTLYLRECAESNRELRIG